MKFTDTTDWKAIPPEPGATPGALTMRLYWAAGTKSAFLSLSKATKDALGVHRHATILLNGRAIAVRASDPSDPNARTVNKAKCIGITTLARHVLRLQPGESFILPVEIDQGHGVAELPAELVTRMREGRAA